MVVWLCDSSSPRLSPSPQRHAGQELLPHPVLLLVLCGGGLPGDGDCVCVAAPGGVGQHCGVLHRHGHRTRVGPRPCHPEIPPPPLHHRQLHVHVRALPVGLCAQVEGTRSASVCVASYSTAACALSAPSPSFADEVSVQQRPPLDFHHRSHCVWRRGADRRSRGAVRPGGPQWLVHHAFRCVVPALLVRLASLPTLPLSLHVLCGIALPLPLQPCCSPVPSGCGTSSCCGSCSVGLPASPCTTPVWPAR